MFMSELTDCRGAEPPHRFALRCTQTAPCPAPTADCTRPRLTQGPTRLLRLHPLFWVTHPGCRHLLFTPAECAAHTTPCLQTAVGASTQATPSPVPDSHLSCLPPAAGFIGLFRF